MPPLTYPPGVTPPPDRASFNSSRLRCRLRDDLQRGPARLIAAGDDAERRLVVLRRARLRSAIRAEPDEDYRTHWDRFGGRPEIDPDDPLEIYDPYVGMISSNPDPLYFPGPGDYPRVTEESAPLPGEDFQAWRDRALWDYIRPDLTDAARVAYFRERIDRAGESGNLRPGFGRFALRTDETAKSRWPDLEAALVADRIAAGDCLLGNRFFPGAWEIFPPLPRLHGYNDRDPRFAESPTIRVLGRRKA